MACLLFGIYSTNANTILLGELGELMPSTTPGPVHIVEAPMPIPSRDTPIFRDRLFEKKRDQERQLDTLGGALIYDYRTPRDSTEYDDFDEEAIDDSSYKHDDNEMNEKGVSKRALDTLGNMQIHGYKRALDTLGNMQIHGFKRGFDSLGGVNLHGGYKRAIDTLGGAFIPAYKRYLSSLGGGLIHGGYKRDDKRYLSSLGGSNIYKRKFDSLGGMNLHSGYKRYFSSLGGANIHNVGNKRTLSSLGGMHIHDGMKRVLGEAQIYGSEDFENDLDKRRLDSLGGFGIHRYKRSDIKESSKGVREEDMQ